MISITLSQDNLPKVADRFAKLASQSALSPEETYEMGIFLELIHTNQSIEPWIKDAEIKMHLENNFGKQFSKRGLHSFLDFNLFQDVSSREYSLGIEDIHLVKEYYQLSSSLDISEKATDRIIEILDESETNLVLSFLIAKANDLLFKESEASKYFSQEELEKQRDKLLESLDLHEKFESYDTHVETSFLKSLCDPIFEEYLASPSDFERALKSSDDKQYLLGEEDAFLDPCQENTKNSLPLHWFKFGLASHSISTLSLKKQTQTILNWACNHLSRVIYVADIQFLLSAHANLDFYHVLRKADVITLGGASLVLLAKILSWHNHERVSGMDLLHSVCQLAPKQNISIFFLGSTRSVLQRMREKLECQYQDLKIAGMEHLPYRPLTTSEDLELIQKINESGAGIVFISIGSPKQECWIAEHKGKISAVMIGLGASFPVYAEICREIPRNIERSGFGWIYRIVNNPGCFLPHYSLRIWLFCRLILKQFLNC